MRVPVTAQEVKLTKKGSNLVPNPRQLGFLLVGIYLKHNPGGQEATVNPGHSRNGQKATLPTAGNTAPHHWGY